MEMEQIEAAVRSGEPFTLKVADGDAYEVPHPDYLFLPPKGAKRRSYIVIHNDEGFGSFLPLLTITSLTYRVDAGGAG